MILKDYPFHFFVLPQTQRQEKWSYWKDTITYTRASGSFPTLLNPVEIDNQLLLDGGIANNFLIEIMREKGVDIMIGVNVQSDLNKRMFHSVIAILNQIISYNIYEQQKRT